MIDAQFNFDEVKTKSIALLLQSSLEDAKALFAAYGMEVSTWSEVPKAVKMLKERNDALREKDEALQEKDKALKEKDNALREKDEIVKQMEKVGVSHTFVRA